VLAQTVHLACIVAQERMPPNGFGFFAAILRHRPTDGFVRAETGTLERLRLAQGAEDKNSILQPLGNLVLRIFQPLHDVGRY